VVVIDESDYLAHYGILRRSGRYPWGSGGSVNTRSRSFLDMVDSLKAEGMSDPDICRALEIGREDHKGVFRPSVTDLRALKTIALNQKRMADIAMAERLKARGWSNPAIAERMGLPGESSVRALLAPGVKDRADVLTSVSNKLREEVDAKTYVDVGSGTERLINIGDGVSNKIGVSPEKLNSAVAMLREEGYVTHTVPIRTAAGHDTRTKVLAPPGTTWADVAKNKDKIQTVSGVSQDGGRTFVPYQPPIAIHPNRVKVNYNEDGGGQADGVIYVRPGVKDVSLGKSRYAQVRVQVGEGHYLKGMAMYKDDLPPGVDLVFNTKKSKKEVSSKLDAMKPIKDDPEFPFGSVTRPLLDENGKHYSAMNVVFEEGDWGSWSKSLSPQFLSKQAPTLAKAQLDKAYDSRQKEFDEIMALTNPTVRKRLLRAFAESADSSAVHMDAAAINQKQAWRAILPISSMKSTEVYAPGYDHGERVVLVRFPHGGTFEIPELTVNNRHPESRKLLGDAKDAIGINHETAKKLSGADFDGDTVIVIPNNQRKIRTSHTLEQLKDFDPMVYKIPKDSPIPRMSKERKGQEMGNISNLITDMTIKGASHEEISRAVKHSMVVIDAEKHELNWKQSALDNNIPSLKKKYQGGADRGASTIISRATSQEWVLDRRPAYATEGGPIDRKTGEKRFVPTGKTKVDKKGNVVQRKQRSTKLAETNDAHTLVSEMGTRVEKIYADHSNKLKGLANKARLELINTPTPKYSASAAKTYAKEVNSLNAKLTLAIMNRPLERHAERVAAAVVKTKRQANPEMDHDTIRKVRYQALAEARLRLKANQTQIEITSDEWNAIQAGAITNHKLDQILAKANMEMVRSLATPRKQRLMTSQKTAQAKRLLSAGYTRSEVAARLGVSLTTLDNSVHGEE